MSVIKVNSRIKDYTISFVQDQDFIVQLREKFPHCYYVVDENVWRLYADHYFKKLPQSDVLMQPISEYHKELTSVQELYDRLIGRSAKRNLTLISIGGGITQDITGFVASTLYRGINWIFIPTTLLAQADSCMGGKTSLNYKGYKNLIGTFYPPTEVYIHSYFLKTLAPPDFFSGLGEIVKLHLLGGEVKFQEVTKLLPKLISRDSSAVEQGVMNSLMIKLSYITDDEFDLGRRNYLNYGHCFGHALEAASNFAIPHGQAVVLGMILANKIARQRGSLSLSHEQMMLNKVLMPSLDIELERGYFQADAIIESMKKDKKRAGEGLVLVMLEDEFNFSIIKDLSPLEVERALAELCQLLSDKEKL